MKVGSGAFILSKKTLFVISKLLEKTKYICLKHLVAQSLIKLYLRK
jgi:hypothetical protein